MNNLFRFFLILILTGWLVGCSGTQNIPEAQTADGQLFLAKCTQCHSWPHPSRHTASEWDHYLGVMEAHMKNKGLPYSENEKKTIRDYLHRNARNQE